MPDDIKFVHIESLFRCPKQGVLCKQNSIWCLACLHEMLKKEWNDLDSPISETDSGQMDPEEVERIEEKFSMVAMGDVSIGLAVNELKGPDL